MVVGFRLFCLVIVSLCHEGLAIEPLAGSIMSLRILKRSGLEGNDPRGGEVMFAGKDQLMGKKQKNGQLFRISKRKEQGSIIPDTKRQFHRFLLKYISKMLKTNYIYLTLFLQGNEKAQCKD